MGIVQVSIAKNEFIRGIHLRLLKCITVSVTALSVENQAQIQFHVSLFNTGITFGFTQDFPINQDEEVENQ